VRRNVKSDQNELRKRPFLASEDPAAALGNNWTSIPYENDPDYIPNPLPAPLSGPGLELSPQEREVVRRLLYHWCRHSEPSLESLLGCLPKGLQLAEGQRKLLERLHPQILRGQLAELHSLWLLDYRNEAPTIEEFIQDDYYLGTSLHPTENKHGLWPGWQDWLKESANLDSFLHNLVITGAIGIGKSLIMVTLLLYRLCLCALLRDPYAFFGLARGSPIFFLLLSVSLSTVKDTLWPTALKLMAASPFFQEVCNFESNKRYANLTIPLVVNPGMEDEVRITFTGGSKAQHQIGRNTLVVGIDEANFRLEKNPQQYGYSLFTDVRTRLTSRFQRGGFMPGLTIVASSAADESSMTEQVIQQIEKDHDRRGQMIVRQAIYRVKPDLKLRPWNFKVAYGLPNVEPFILRGCYGHNGAVIAPSAECPAQLSASQDAVPEGAQTELVPGDYYDDFARCTWKALQQHSGISLGGTHRLFPSLVDIEKCLTESAQENVLNPARVPVFIISDEDSRTIRDELVPGTFVTKEQGRYQPSRHPHRKRFAHLDLATTGMAGLAICHLADPPATPGPQAAGCNSLSFRLTVEYDFILTITGGKTRPISFEKILNFIVWLRGTCGYQFGMVTADSYQSTFLLQTLQSRGFETQVQSVDRDKRAYLAWKTGFQEGRIRLYRQDQLLKEVAALIELDKKIEHPAEGTKDTADAAAGAFLNAISSQEFRDLGGFQGPPLIQGVSATATASVQDPFGFPINIPSRPIRVF